MDVCTVSLLSALLASGTPRMPLATGYVEREYVQIALVSTAQLLELSVAAGEQVGPGQALVTRRDRYPATAREGEIAAAEAALREATGAGDHALWQLDKRALVAPTAGVVTDILRRPGENAAAGEPILALLPDGAVRLRLYLPEANLDRATPADRLDMRCDTCPPGLTATISYIAD